MITKGENVNSLSEKIVDAVLADNILTKEAMFKKVASIMRAWIVINDRPHKNLNDEKVHRLHIGRVVAEADAKFWKAKLFEAIGEGKVRELYPELDEIRKSFLIFDKE